MDSISCVQNLRNILSTHRYSSTGLDFITAQTERLLYDGHAVYNEKSKIYKLAEILK